MKLEYPHTLNFIIYLFIYLHTYLASWRDIQVHTYHGVHGWNQRTISNIGHFACDRVSLSFPNVPGQLACEFPDVLQSTPPTSQKEHWDHKWIIPAVYGI